MVNINGTLFNEKDASLSINNRGYKYGDALFETIKVMDGKVLFWEDHYFRLMASMRILRMEIPMNFTMEFLEAEMLKTVEANNLKESSARIRLNVHRKDGGTYMPEANTIDFHIVVSPLEGDVYKLDTSPFLVDLFKDYFVAPGLLSTIKSNNKLIHVLGNIYAKENKFDTCLLLNTNKQVVEGLNGNLFLVKDKVIKTPPIEDGCLKGIMRKQILEILFKMEGYKVKEASISPFELQQADELFITNVIVGAQPISSYRKKTYTTDISKLIVDRLNVKIRLV